MSRCIYAPLDRRLQYFLQKAFVALFFLFLLSGRTFAFESESEESESVEDAEFEAAYVYHANRRDPRDEDHIGQNYATFPWEDGSPKEPNQFVEEFDSNESEASSTSESEEHESYSISDSDSEEEESSVTSPTEEETFAKHHKRRHNGYGGHHRSRPPKESPTHSHKGVGRPDGSGGGPSNVDSRGVSDTDSRDGLASNLSAIVMSGLLALASTFALLGLAGWVIAKVMNQFVRQHQFLEHPYSKGRTLSVAGRSCAVILGACSLYCVRQTFYFIAHLDIMNSERCSSGGTSFFRFLMAWPSSLHSHTCELGIGGRIMNTAAQLFPIFATLRVGWSLVDRLWRRRRQCQLLGDVDLPMTGSSFLSMQQESYSQESHNLIPPRHFPAVRQHRNSSSTSASGTHAYRDRPPLTHAHPYSTPPTEGPFASGATKRQTYYTSANVEV